MESQPISLDQFTIVFPKNGRGRIHAPYCWRSARGVTRPLTAQAWNAGRVDMGACCKTYAPLIQDLATHDDAGSTR